MTTGQCRLCLLHPAIENSHILPRFVYRAIKSDSPTGFFRNPYSPNCRVQDGDKVRLLCTQCEQRFGSAEREFATHAFSAFHETDRDEFAYGPWLHYFMTSLAWRTLILDLPGLEADAANPRPDVMCLTTAADTMRHCLLGASNAGGLLRSHAFVFTKAHSGTAQLMAAGPNVKIRRSVFGYSVLDRAHGYSGVVHNLAGFMCFLIVKGNPRDTWHQTKVDPAGGELKQPQRVHSWLIAEVLNTVVESSRAYGTMSDSQREKVNEAAHRNPKARSLRFLEMDRQTVVTD